MEPTATQPSPPKRPRLVCFVNGIFGDGDDVIYVLTPQYVPGSTVVTLGIDGGNLPLGDYRFTIRDSM